MAREFEQVKKPSDTVCDTTNDPLTVSFASWQETQKLFVGYVSGLEKYLPSMDMSCFFETDAEKSEGEDAEEEVAEGEIAECEVSECAEAEGDKPQSPEEVAKEVRDTAVDPLEVLITAMKESRVLAFGDYHTEPNPQALFLTENLAKLKAAGATHVALELDAEFQPYIDEFMKTGKMDPEFEEAIHKLCKTPDAMLKLIRAAREAGLKPVCVDDWGFNSPHGQLPPNRDEIMAKRMQKILDSDKDAKIVYYAGNQHVAKWKGGKNAADLLEDGGAKVTRIMNMPSVEPSAVVDAVSGSIDKPIASPVDKVDMIKKGGLKEHPYDKTAPKPYDFAFFYPHKKGYEPIAKELEEKGKPAVDALTDAIKNNSVIEVFLYSKMDHGDPNSKEFREMIKSGRRKESGRGPTYKDGDTPDYEFLKSKMEDFKKAGVTILAISAAIDHEALERFNKTGKLELSEEQMKALGKHTIELLKAAQKAGIKVVSLGMHGNMDKDVQDMLAKNPKDKILILSTDDPEDAQKSISGKLKAKGVSAVGVGMVSPDYGSDGDYLPGVSGLPKLVGKPTGVKTKDVPKTKDFSIKVGTKMGAYDYVLVLPR
jgi:hypothetical protein